MRNLEYVTGKIEFILAVIAISVNLDLIFALGATTKLAIMFVLLGVIQLVSICDNLYRWRRHVLFMYVPLWILMYCDIKDPAFILLSIESAMIYTLLRHFHSGRLIHGLTQ